MTQPARRLPNGIQSFEVIRKDNYLYVDKTDIIYQLANGSMYNYISRPRRFGKSVLVDTLRCYFEGRRDLFGGLKIMELEHEWCQHPVIRLDMSGGGETAQSLTSFLDNQFYRYEKKYGITVLQGSSLADRFNAIIEGVYSATSMPVVVLIDEYDYPLIHSWHTDNHTPCTEIYRNVFAILKSATIYLRFVFITGIAKFTQISLFSVLNNLNNISFDAQYATLCGITQEELERDFAAEIERLGNKYKWTTAETLLRLKERYDGYHFSGENMVDVYNPFSLIQALDKAVLLDYWAQSGATTYLTKFINHMEVRMREFDDCYEMRNTLETSDISSDSNVLFLFQSGYLTIKGLEDDMYHLGFPNLEVRTSLYDTTLPALAMRNNNEVSSLQNRLRMSMMMGDVEQCFSLMQSLCADVPYSNKRLALMDMEERYRLIMSTIFNAIGLRCEVERMTGRGRIDIVVWTTRHIYVLELKLTKNGGLAAAVQQMRDRDYAAPFRADSRHVIALAIEIDDEGKASSAMSR